MGLFWLLGFDFSGRVLSLCQAALGATIPALFLWGGGWLYLKIRHREGLGLGDVKLMVMIGAFLGLQATLQTLLIGSLSGSVISLLYIWISKKDASTYELPFGTFLAGAALAVAMVGYEISPCLCGSLRSHSSPSAPTPRMARTFTSNAARRVTTPA